MVQQWQDVPRRSELGELSSRIKAYFTGRRVEFSVPLDLAGVTEFRQRVLLACAAIPYGQTRSYGQLAKAVRSNGAARAVGGAMAHNPIPLIIPCHRILAANGRLGGFSAEGGTAVKAKMLGLEGLLRSRAIRT
jgi:methylated-DNA-[protein]-cysteine S-methyltransferase